MTSGSLIKKLKNAGYYADGKTAEAVNAAMTLKKPLLVEGEPGVGKTSLASALAKSTGRRLIRLQMYEGLTDDKVLYDYDYTKQLLCLEAVKKNFEKKYSGYGINKALADVAETVDFYQEDFLIERPVLKSIRCGEKCVLLIDEIDKAPEELEYMFYEFFENYSISIPQYGTVECPGGMEPVVILTSNGYRELSDALKRRCAYLYIPRKTAAEMAEIIRAKAEVDEDFAKAVAGFLAYCGDEKSIRQKPSVADGVDWAKYLSMSESRDLRSVKNSLGILFKSEGDMRAAEKLVTNNAKLLKGIAMEA